MISCHSSRSKLIQVSILETALPLKVAMFMVTDSWRSGAGEGAPQWANSACGRTALRGVWEPGSTGTRSAGSTRPGSLSALGFMSPHYRAKYEGHAEGWCAPMLGLDIFYRFSFISLGSLSIWAQKPPWISFKYLIRGRFLLNTKIPFCKVEKSFPLELRLEPPEPKTNCWECGKYLLHHYPSWQSCCCLMWMEFEDKDNESCNS